MMRRWRQTVRRYSRLYRWQRVSYEAQFEYMIHDRAHCKGDCARHLPAIAGPRRQ